MARGVVSLVLGYLNNLVIEMAFLIQVIKTVISSQHIWFGVKYLIFLLQDFRNSWIQVEIKYKHMFFIFLQANTQEELPEFLLGTCRLNHMNIAKTVSTDSIKTI